MVRELDFCDQNSFPLLYQFKVENEEAQQILVSEVVEAFNKNKGDPKVHQEAEKMNR